jgi:hypothetical protein
MSLHRSCGSLIPLPVQHRRRKSAVYVDSDGVRSLQELQARGMLMKATRSTVLSMRLSVENGKRLKRLANRHGWTPSDASGAWSRRA